VCEIIDRIFCIFLQEKARQRREDLENDAATKVQILHKNEDDYAIVLIERDTLGICEVERKENELRLISPSLSATIQLKFPEIPLNNETLPSFYFCTDSSSMARLLVSQDKTEFRRVQKDSREE